MRDITFLQQITWFFLLTFGYEFVFMIKLEVYIHQYDNCAKK